MNLDISNWKEFRTDRIFPLLKVGKANQQLLEDGNDCFYVGAKRECNGVMIHCAKDQALLLKGNCIVFICNGQGSVGFANYMNVDFMGTTDIVAGYNKNLNEWNGLFLATIYCQERPKYSFGRKWKTHLADTIVKLPVVYKDDKPLIDDKCEYSDEGYVPDWQFMESYVKGLHHKPLTTGNADNVNKEIKVQDWKEFRLGDYLSKVYKAKAINKDDIPVATDPNYAIRYITRTAENNGCEMLADVREIDSKNIEKPNAISIGDTTATCFYQEKQFITGDHMVIVRADKWLNKYTAMFIVALLNNEQYKYSYGRAFLKDRIEDTLLKLPADEHGEPDWNYMEKYIKSLPYGDRL